jgi:hypothetical protein
VRGSGERGAARGVPQGERRQDVRRVIRCSDQSAVAPSACAVSGKWSRDVNAAEAPILEKRRVDDLPPEERLAAQNAAADLSPRAAALAAAGASRSAALTRKIRAHCLHFSALLKAGAHYLRFQTCFCGVFRSATTAANRSRSAVLTSMLIPSRMTHHNTQWNSLGILCLFQTTRTAGAGSSPNRRSSCAKYRARITAPTMARGGSSGPGAAGTAHHYANLTAPRGGKLAETGLTGF